MNRKITSTLATFGDFCDGFADGVEVVCDGIREAFLWPIRWLNGE